MEKLEQLKNNAFNNSIYSSGYISFLIAKLMERYEGIRYSVGYLNNIGIKKWCLIPGSFTDEQHSVIILDEINVVPNVYPDFDLNKTSNKQVMCLSPSFNRNNTSDVNALSDEVIKSYPYIQDFINFLFVKRVELNDEVLFVKNLKNYLNQFIKEYEKYDKPRLNKDCCDKTCKMDRDTLLKTIKYIVNRYERYGTCEVGLDIVADSIDDLEVFHLYRTLEIDTPNGNVKTGMYAGEFLEEGKPYNTYYKSSDIDLRKYLSVLVNDYQSLNKELKYLPIFLRELYILSLEKEYITSADVSYILSSISNDRKLKRTRR